MHKMAAGQREGEVMAKKTSDSTNKGGRPPKFKNKEEMQEKIDQYFKDCEGKVLKDDKNEPIFNKHGQVVIVGQKPLTMTGLARALGFSSRQSLLNYEGKKEFLDTIMRARMRVEEYTEECLFYKESANGAKFSLANNFAGWTEKKEIEADIHTEKLEDVL